MSPSPRGLGKKEAIVAAAAALGIALIVWNWSDKISAFWNYLGFSNPSPITSSETTSCRGAKTSSCCSSSASESVQKASEMAPESMKSAEKEEPSAAVVEQKPVGNIAPEATEAGKTTTSSVYVGLPKSDPSAVSSHIPPSNSR